MNNTNPELYLEEINIIIKNFSCKDHLICLKHFGYEPRYKKEKRIAYLYKNAGNIYKINDLLKSVECYNNSILYFEKIKNKSDIRKDLAECYINSALIYYQLKNNVKSLELYKKGTEIYKQLEYNDKLLKYYENMSDIYILDLEYNNSILYLNKIFEILNNYEITHINIQKKINITYKL
jgi:tetratricopeptide (TPR) repeat protein